MFLLLDEDESVGPISAVHTHRYSAKKIAFFERAPNFHLIDLFNHCDSCCHEVDLWRMKILEAKDYYPRFTGQQNAIELRWNDHRFFCISWLDNWHFLFRIFLTEDIFFSQQVVPRNRITQLLHYITGFILVLPVQIPHKTLSHVVNDGEQHAPSSSSTAM